MLVNQKGKELFCLDYSIEIEASVYRKFKEDFILNNLTTQSVENLASLNYVSRIQNPSIAKQWRVSFRYKILIMFFVKGSKQSIF